VNPISQKQKKFVKKKKKNSTAWFSWLHQWWMLVGTFLLLELYSNICILFNLWSFHFFKFRRFTSVL